VSLPDKGKFTAEISQAIIDEALQSVEKPHGEEVVEQTDEDAVADAPEQIVRALNELRSQLALSEEKSRDTQAKFEALQEQLVRTTADFENHRKRSRREAEDIRHFGAEKLLMDFLPVIDNLDRALDHGKTGADLAGLKQGVAMTRKLFDEVLAKHGVKRLSSVGEPFDPQYHEAFQHLETTDWAPNYVISELVPGYVLHQRLLRPALVAVSKGLAGRKPTGPDTETSEGAQAPEPTPEPD
jgi:molecular chaperone GrpE